MSGRSLTTEERKSRPKAPKKTVRPLVLIQVNSQVLTFLMGLRLNAKSGACFLDATTNSLNSTDSVGSNVLPLQVYCNLKANRAKAIHHQHLQALEAQSAISDLTALLKAAPLSKRVQFQNKIFQAKFLLRKINANRFLIFNMKEEAQARWKMAFNQRSTACVFTESDESEKEQLEIDEENEGKLILETIRNKEQGQVRKSINRKRGQVRNSLPLIKSNFSVVKSCDKIDRRLFRQQIQNQNHLRHERASQRLPQISNHPSQRSVKIPKSTNLRSQELGLKKHKGVQHKEQKRKDLKSKKKQFINQKKKLNSINMTKPNLQKINQKATSRQTSTLKDSIVLNQSKSKQSNSPFDLLKEKQHFISSKLGLDSKVFPEQVKNYGQVYKSLQLDPHQINKLKEQCVQQIIEKVKESQSSQAQIMIEQYIQLKNLQNLKGKIQEELDQLNVLHHEELDRLLGFWQQNHDRITNQLQKKIDQIRKEQEIVVPDFTREFEDLFGAEDSKDVRQIKQNMQQIEKRMINLKSQKVRVDFLLKKNISLLQEDVNKKIVSKNSIGSSKSLKHSYTVKEIKIKAGRMNQRRRKQIKRMLNQQKYNLKVISALNQIAKLKGDYLSNQFFMNSVKQQKRLLLNLFHQANFLSSVLEEESIQFEEHLKQIREKTKNVFLYNRWQFEDMAKLIKNQTFISTEQAYPFSTQMIYVIDEDIAERGNNIPQQLSNYFSEKKGKGEQQDSSSNHRIKAFRQMKRLQANRTFMLQKTLYCAIKNF